MAERWFTSVARSAELAIGGWVVEESLTAVQAYAAAGFDYVGIDCQHTLVDERAAARLIQAPPASCPMVVRVSRNEPALIGLLLDAGADGVIVPAVETAEEAARATAAFQYPPNGVRSFGPFRRDLSMDPESLSERSACLVMIETQQGLQNLKSITSVPRVDGVYVGPADLSIGLGMSVATAFTTDQLAPALTEIRLACKERGLLLGAHATDVGAAVRWADLGINFVSIGSSTRLIRVAAAQLAAEIATHRARRRSTLTPVSTEKPRLYD